MSRNTASSRSGSSLISHGVGSGLSIVSSVRPGVVQAPAARNMSTEALQLLRRTPTQGSGSTTDAAPVVRTSSAKSWEHLCQLGDNFCVNRPLRDDSADKWFNVVNWIES